MNQLLKLKFLIKGKKFVGKDKFGNKYFTYEMNGIEKRDVEPSNPKDMFADDLPVEWISWLQQRRNDPPSEELSNLLEKERERRRNLK